MKVLLTTNIPAPYMVDYLDCLGKKCELTVVFEMGNAKDRTSKWYGTLQNRSFQYVFLNAIPTSAESGFSFKILSYLTKKYDRIIIANPTTPTGILALLYCKCRKIPFLLQSEGGFRGSGRGLKEKFKKFIMQDAQLYLSGMQGETDYFFSYGATDETLRTYPFSSLHKEQIDSAVLTKEEKRSLRDELHITEEKVIISVGRTLFCKGFDLLLKAKAGLPQTVGLYIVGAEPVAEYQKIIEDCGLKNVHFVSHCPYDQLCRYYHAADIFALPTRGDTWGLVINEAMANGLPVITTDRCIAGLQLIENDINGYIIPNEDVSQLTEKLLLLLSREDTCLCMAENNLKKIQPYSIENMADVIFNFITINA